MLLNIDPLELESAIIDVNERMAGLVGDVPCEDLRALHRDVSTLVDLLWIDEVTKFTERYTKAERSRLLKAITLTATLLDRLPALPEHAN